MSESQTEADRPVVAVVGRPNVGKSMLVNRIIGRRGGRRPGPAGGDPRPGQLRRRVGRTRLRDRRHRRLGTGREGHGRADRRAGRTGHRRRGRRALRRRCDCRDAGRRRGRRRGAPCRSRKPVVLAANKVDDVRIEVDAAAMWNLGLGEPHPVSAMHGRGTGDLLDALLEVLPASTEPGEAAEAGPRWPSSGVRTWASRHC